MKKTFCLCIAALLLTACGGEKQETADALPPLTEMTTAQTELPLTDNIIVPTETEPPQTEAVTEKSSEETLSPEAEETETETEQPVLPDEEAEEEVPEETSARETPAEEEETAPAVPPEPEVEYKPVYKKLLTELCEGEHDDTASFELYDLDSDGIPELFVSLFSYHAAGVEVYAICGEEAKNIGGAGSWGAGAYVNGSYFMGGYAGMGAEYTYYYEKHGDELVLIRSIGEGMSMDSDDMFYEINEISVTEEEYEEAKIKGTGEWIDIGHKYPLTTEAINEVFGE